MRLTENEKKTVIDCVYHRFFKFEPNMNLIKVDDNQVGRFKSVEAGKGSDILVPINYLNSIEHIDKPMFIPDLNHEPTINTLLNSSLGSMYRFEFYKCEVFNEEGWTIQSDEAMLCGPFSTKPSTLLWAICITPPF